MSAQPTRRSAAPHVARGSVDSPVAAPRDPHTPIDGPEMPPLTQNLSTPTESPYAQVSPSDQRVLDATPHAPATRSGATSTTRPTSRLAARSPLHWLSTVGLVLMILGGLMTVTGVGSYIATSTALSAEKISVPKDADAFAGASVGDPFTAWSTQATIRKHADAMAGGKTYAELGKDDPKRPQLQTASFLRSSILVSVLAFGMSALIAGLGLIVGLVGFALRKLSTSLN